MEPTFKGKVIGMSLKDRGNLACRAFCQLGILVQQKLVLLFLVLLCEKLQTGFRNSMMKSTICLISIKVDLLKPKSTYNESLEDNNPYEGKLYNSAPVFLMI
jgi:hypothetical protein